MEASFSFRIFKGIRLNRRVAATVAARRIPMTGEKEKSGSERAVVDARAWAKRV